MITSGFFNSHNGDRKYDAEQFSSLFGGIITDGVFKHYPGTNQHFNISVSGRTITLGPGRAWLNNVWINSDSNYTVRLDQLSQVQVNAGYERVDALYFKIDKSNNGRQGSIYVAKGTPGTHEDTLAFTEMADTDEVFYHLIGIFRVVPTGNTIGSWQSRIGWSSGGTPYIIGPLEAETLLAQFNETVDAKVQQAMDQYMSDDGSALYEKVRSVPMIWLCDLPVPTTENFTGTLYRSIDHPTSGMAKLFPNFFGEDNLPPTVRYPQEGDIVLGSNGSWATVFSVQLDFPSGHCDQYSIIVKGTGCRLSIST